MPFLCYHYRQGWGYILKGFEEGVYNMKKFYSWAILPVFVLNLNVTTICQQAGSAVPSGKNISSFTFASYLAKSWWNTSIADKQEPFSFPGHLPDAKKLAGDIKLELFRHKKFNNFLFGASTSEHQCSQRCTPEICSWSRFVRDNDLQDHIKSADYKMDLWTHYKSYIDYAAHDLGLNALRFSVEWPLVQPDGPRSFNQEALDHYADLFVYAIKQGIAPIICFHHYTDPCWFLDQGGFERAGNVKHFVNFCKKIYEEAITQQANDPEALQALNAMYPRQPLWATFNSPEGYAFKGYREMTSPPANSTKKGLKVVMEVIKNIMDAHVGVYHALKQSYADIITDKASIQDDAPTEQSLDTASPIKEPQIGLLKNIHQLDPADTSTKEKALKPLSRLVCAVGNMLQNECFYQFFTTGKFSIQVPFSFNVTHQNDKAKGALDWIGANYYSNGPMCLDKICEETDPALMTDNKKYRMHPQGLYRAIAELSDKIARPLDIPLYVTENGIATSSIEKRTKFYQEYMYALFKAIRDGYPVRGYLTWTLADNYEWPNKEKGGRRTYGLCTVDAEHPEKLTAKPGSQFYLDLAKHTLAGQN